MSILRIYCPASTGHQCKWALLDERGGSIPGEGDASALPRRADRVQLIVPAAQALIIRAHVPAAARRSTGSVLAYAIEEKTVSEPDANYVTWVGTSDDHDVLAVLDREYLQNWRATLEKLGIRNYEVHSEMLLLPWEPESWSVAWDGREGFVRISAFEGAITDSGDRETPPLSLRMMIEQAETNRKPVRSIAVFSDAADHAPDTQMWQQHLGVPVHFARQWTWRDARSDTGISLVQERPRWGGFPATASKLRPAAWIAGIALALHAVALSADWMLLAGQQARLRQQMETRFRAVFPDTVAVVDPVLQTRRKLTDIRHQAGQADLSDFLPLVERVAAELKDIPTGALRIVSYESGRMTLEMAALDEPTVSRMVLHLRQAGLNAEASSTGRANVVLTVRTS